MAAPILGLGLETKGLKELQAAIKAADPVLAKALRKALKGVGEAVATKARSNASWSREIPGTIKVGVTAKGVNVKAGGAKAPQSAIYEKGGRHPTFGHDPWVPVAAKPYMVTALSASEQAMEKAALDVLSEWTQAIGFK